MYAGSNPVSYLWRLLRRTDCSLVKTILALPAMQNGTRSAAAEPWIIEATEAA